MNFFWTEKEYDFYVRERGLSDEVGKEIYKLDIYEALKASEELFFTLKYIKKIV